MKTADIKIGRSYSNGKGRTRKVLDIGDYPLYPGQRDRNCVLYEYDGLKLHMTLVSFANWAKMEVSD